MEGQYHDQPSQDNTSFSLPFLSLSTGAGHISSFNELFHNVSFPSEPLLTTQAGLQQGRSHTMKEQQDGLSVSTLPLTKEVHTPGSSKALLQQNAFFAETPATAVGTNERQIPGGEHGGVTLPVWPSLPQTSEGGDLSSFTDLFGADTVAPDALTTGHLSTGAVMPQDQRTKDGISFALASLPVSSEGVELLGLKNVGYPASLNGALQTEEQQQQQPQGSMTQANAHNSFMEELLKAFNVGEGPSVLSSTNAQAQSNTVSGPTSGFASPYRSTVTTPSTNLTFGNVSGGGYAVALSREHSATGGLGTASMKPATISASIPASKSAGTALMLPPDPPTLNPQILFPSMHQNQQLTNHAHNQQQRQSQTTHSVSRSDHNTIPADLTLMVADASGSPSQQELTSSQRQYLHMSRQRNPILALYLMQQQQQYLQRQHEHQQYQPPPQPPQPPQKQRSQNAAAPAAEVIEIDLTSDDENMANDEPVSNSSGTVLSKRKAPPWDEPVGGASGDGVAHNDKKRMIQKHRQNHVEEHTGDAESHSSSQHSHPIAHTRQPHLNSKDIEQKAPSPAQGAGDNSGVIDLTEIDSDEEQQIKVEVKRRMKDAEIVCYGMVQSEPTLTQEGHRMLVGNGEDPQIKLYAELAASKRYYDLKLITADGSHIGNVNTRLAEALGPLLQSLRLHPSIAQPVSQNPEFPPVLNLLCYGPVIRGPVVGSQLLKYQFPLVPPPQQQTVRYINPQLQIMSNYTGGAGLDGTVVHGDAGSASGNSFRYPYVSGGSAPAGGAGVGGSMTWHYTPTTGMGSLPPSFAASLATGMGPSSSSSSNQIKTADEVKSQIDEVYKSLAGAENMPEMEPDERLLTPLYRHQKQALWFMTAREEACDQETLRDMLVRDAEQRAAVGDGSGVDGKNTVRKPVGKTRVVEEDDVLIILSSDDEDDE
ncbi:hypothetical protein HK102_006245, partial [Quaeritorhiza haematococci]